MLTDEHFFILVPIDPVMYLSFDNVTADGVVNDNSGNNNKALLEKGAAMSPRILGKVLFKPLYI